MNGVRWQDIPADFAYPKCRVCGEDTPVFTKSRVRIPHCKRLTAKTCGRRECRTAMISRPKVRGKYKVKAVRPLVVSDLDFGFQLFNFDRGSIERLVKKLY